MAKFLGRVGKGRRQLKKNLQVYGSHCSIADTTVIKFLIAVHLEPHAPVGINVSINALLLPSDSHICTMAT